MLIVGSERLDKRDGRKLVLPQGRPVVLFILEVLRAAGRAVRVPGKVREDLVVKLKERIGVSRQGIVPPA